MSHSPPWRWNWGRRGRGRRPKPRIIDFRLPPVVFMPLDSTGRPMGGDPVELMPDELEALRLVYFLDLNQEQAAQRMGVSRGTLWRALSSGRKKIIKAIVERRPLVISR